jgi:hypothetical protein
MEITEVLIVVAIIIVVYVLVNYASGGAKSHTSLTSGLQMQVIKANDLMGGSSSPRSNYSMSMWFYIDDWNYNYGVHKPLAVRYKAGTATTEDLVPGLKAITPCPAIVLGGTDNVLDIFQAVLPPDSGSIPTGTNAQVINGETISRCSLSNIPIQKWVNLIVSFYGRTCDVYLDGKLVRTCVMDGIPKVDKDANMYITPSLEENKGSFKGWTSNFQYFQTAMNPQQAYDIYTAGFGGAGWLSSLLSTEVKVTFSKNGKTESEYSM